MNLKINFSKKIFALTKNFMILGIIGYVLQKIDVS